MSRSPLLLPLLLLAAAVSCSHSFGLTTTPTLSHRAAPRLSTPTSTLHPRHYSSSSSSTFPSVRKYTTHLKDATTATTPPDPAEHGGTSTTTASIFNLVKGIVGAGVLSLPAGKILYYNNESYFLIRRIVALKFILTSYHHSLITQSHYRCRILCQCSIGNHSCHCAHCCYWWYKWILLLLDWQSLCLYRCRIVSRSMVQVSG